jgi:hypothetical protein
MSNRRCASCHSWGGCPGFEWYEPNEIQFCSNQIFFIIENLNALEIGEYPPNHENTGYTGGNSKPQFRSGGNFMTAATLFAEFDRRLKRTGKAGKTLIHEVTVLDAQRPDRLSQTARDALYYCAGRDAKRMSFAGWLAQRERRRRMMNINLFHKPEITLEKSA